LDISILFQKYILFNHCERFSFQILTIRLKTVGIEIILQLK
jgi:hypothetical protein